MVSRGVRGAIYGLVAGACALAPSLVYAAVSCDFTATSCVVRCEPLTGENSVAFKPKGFSSSAQETTFEVKKLVVDNCIADSSMGNDGTGANQLADWKTADKHFGFIQDPAKSGPIAAALVATTGTGFVNCDPVNQSDNTYPVNGKIAIVWLDGAGVKTGAKSEGWTAASIDAANFAAVNTGIVTKGLGVGATISTGAGVDLSGGACDTVFSDSAAKAENCHDGLSNVIDCASSLPTDNHCAIPLSAATATTCKKDADCSSGQVCRRPVTVLPLKTNATKDFLEITFGDVQTHS